MSPPAPVSRIAAIVATRCLEYGRDRGFVVRNIVLPLIIIAVLASSVAGGPKPVFSAAVLGAALPSPQSEPLLATPLVQFFAEPNAAASLHKVALQQADIALDFAGRRYWVNTLSPKGRLLQRLLLGAGEGWTRGQVSGEQARYVDWIVPAILGLNIALSSLFGIGNNIVAYRKSGFLKRLSATPLRPLEFLLGQLLSRVLIVVAVNAVVFAICRPMLHLRMQGSYLDLAVVSTAGVMAVAAVALFIAARFSSDELVTGILNLVFAAMMLVSGAFFSTDGAPRGLRWLAELSPLTHLLAAARAVMLDGATLVQLAPALAALAAMILGWTLAAALVFRWRAD